MAAVITFPPFPPGGPGPLQGLLPLRFRGPWGATTAYIVNDGVLFNGSSYVAIAANTGQQPDISPLTWNLIAQGAPGSSNPGIDTLSNIIASVGSIIYKASTNPTGWVALAPGAAGQVLQTPGANQAPVWASLSATQSIGGIQQSFTTAATYTPTPGMKVCIVECWGGGGGGGGAANSGIGQSTGGFGGSGGYSRRVLTALQIGAGQTVIIGPGGLGGAAGTNNGAPGGDTTVGTILCVAKGGSQGLGALANANGAGGLGGILGTGDETEVGSPGDTGVYSNVSGIIIPLGRGGQTALGQGGVNGSAPPNANSGAGGGGGISVNNSGDTAGGNGANGFCRITEFLFS
jgi:hypothetical protein